MSDNFLVESEKRSNYLITSILEVLVGLSVLLYIFVVKVSWSITIFLGLVGFGLCLLLKYFPKLLNIKLEAIKYISMTLNVIYIHMILIVLGESNRSVLYVAFVMLFLSVLYFNWKVTLYTGIFTIILNVVTYFAAAWVYSRNFAVVSLLSILVIYIFGMIASIWVAREARTILKNQEESITQIHNLEDILGYIKTTSSNLKETNNTLNVYSTEFKELIENINETTQSTALQIEQQEKETATVSESIRLINRVLEETATASEQAVAESNCTLDVADKGESFIIAALGTIKNVGKIFDEYVSSIETLKHQSSEINKIVDLINSVSKQTGLLALNASIESARAGEAGKGFAVVAGEIGNLANQAELAIKDINKNVNQIVDTINTAFQNVTSGQEAVTYSLGNIEKIENSLNEIINSVKNSYQGTFKVQTSIEEVFNQNSRIVGFFQSLQKMSSDSKNKFVEVLSATHLQSEKIGMLIEIANEMSRLAEELNNFSENKQ